jgi:hypothetical protein
MLGMKGISCIVPDTDPKIEAREMNYIQYFFFQQERLCRCNDERLSAICALVYKYERRFYDAMSVYESRDLSFLFQGGNVLTQCYLLSHFFAQFWLSSIFAKEEATGGWRKDM